VLKIKIFFKICLIFLITFNIKAAELDEIQVLSGIGQKANFLIKIIKNENDKGSYVARISSPEKFINQKLFYSSHVVDLVPTITTINNETFIKITSRNNISVPYLNILVELIWASGQTTKKFSIFIPPEEIIKFLNSENWKSYVSKLVDESKKIKNQKEKKALVTNDLSETSTFSKPNFQKDLMIKVTEGDTLSKILRQIDGGDLTAAQIMEVLLRVNPNAFIDNNINYLRLNAQLIIPKNISEIALSIDQAKEIINNQNNFWINKNKGKVALAEKVDNSEKEVLELKGLEKQDGENINSNAQERITYLEEQIMIKDKQIINANERLEKLEVTINELKQLIKSNSGQINIGENDNDEVKFSLNKFLFTPLDDEYMNNFTMLKVLKNNIQEDYNFLLKITLFQIILISFLIIFILFSFFRFSKKKKISSYMNNSTINTNKSNLSNLQSNDETAFDLSKIDLSLDKNNIEIADVKKSFAQEETISDSEAKSKLDLAKAYIEMDNISSANEVITELINQASSTYRKLALELSEQIKK
jgi:FimV-like protein